MSKIVECVPNFSEGRDKKIVDTISSAVRSVAGVSLLDVDPGASTNRTVYTFVGTPDAVVEAALMAAMAAYECIDMTKHKGEHPRMGTLDVCPFIPVRGVTEEECVEVAKTFGSQLAESLKVPVFLYGKATDKDYRKTMPQIRAGEYEGLENKLQKPEWQPDFGPSTFVPRWGATVTGVRKFLIAYNVNVLSTKEQAHRIALNLREGGRGPGKEGRLKAVQGIGWYLKEENLAQVSLNLTDYNVTPLHVAYEECKKDAEELNLAVTGSEIVGLLPLSAILQAAEFYIKKENLFIMDEIQKVRLTIDRLGLSSMSRFNPKERIIEYCLPQVSSLLASSPVSTFVACVAARSPAPGGGSVAALVAALGASLGAMVGQLTYGKRQWEQLDSVMRELLPLLHNTAMDCVPLIDEDTKAFDELLAASRLPKDTGEACSRRDVAILKATNQAINIPLSLMKKIAEIWSPMAKMAENGNINCKSDIQVGARCLEAGAWGAYYNVIVNLDNISDEVEKEKIKKEAKKLLEKSTIGSMETLQIVENRKEKNN